MMDRKSTEAKELDKLLKKRRRIEKIGQEPSEAD